MLKKILIGAGALVGLLVLAVGAFIVFFPKQAAIAEIERRIEAATERDLTLGGDVELSFWPALGFSARQASLSNPHGFASSAPFLAADRIVFAVSVMPLLSGHIEVKRLILEGADLRLEAKRDGTTNWTFPTDDSQPNSLNDLRIEELRIAHGRISFQAADATPPFTFENVDSNLSLDSLDKPADLQSAFDYRGQRVNLTAHVEAPRAMLEKGRTQMRLDARTTTLSANFDGAFNAADGAMQGRTVAEGTSLRGFMGWLGSPMAEGGGFGAFRLEADMAQAGPRTSLTNSVLRLDDIVARGPLEILQQPSGKLKISGTITAPSIDLNPYLPASPQGTGGVAASTAWSSDPLDLTGLRSIDADLTFSTPALKFQNLSFTDAQMSLRIANGAADARLTRIALYGGTGTARLIADGSGATPRVAVEMNADNIQALPFLRDAIAFDKIEGRGRVTAALAGQGRSQDAIMRSLRGTSSFRFNDGAWKGVNLAGIARFVNSARTSEAMGANSSTDFAEFSSSFTVTNGVAATDNLKMLGPFVRLDGTGVVDIGAQTLDMRLSPRAVNTSQGQGSTEGAAGGIGIPFTATGPWARPSFRPAIGDAIASRARDMLRGGDQSNPLNALGNAIFGNRTQPSTNTTSTTTPAPSTSTTTSTTTTTTTTTTTRNPLEEIFRRN